MRVYDVILKKRNKEELTKEEILYMIEGFTTGSIPDYQMSAFLMAVWFNKMNGRERADLTLGMLNSGKKIDLSDIEGIKVDKHSTGGVGDGVSLSLAPLVASYGCKIPMMSGRGLGHTGGTLDKLESIPGYTVELDSDYIKQALKDVGLVIMGQTPDIAPADKKMYALRDVTATVDSIDLIAGSIMSKKLAEGMDALILDVKTGNGAFMQKYEDSVGLAKAMVEIGVNLGKDMCAVITDMNQPLGRAVGNSLEMIQAIEICKNNGPADIVQLVKYIGAHMLRMSKVVEDIETGKQYIQKSIENGEGLKYLQKMIEVHKGNPAVADDISLMPQASNKKEIISNTDGYVYSINAMDIGIAAQLLGAGRENMESKLDYSAGFILERKIGDKVSKGDLLGIMHYNDEYKEKSFSAENKFRNAFEIGTEMPTIKPLIYSEVYIDNVIEKNILREK